MPNNNKEFKEGLKATSLFGGVQVISILISVIKSKVVAVLLGPEGMGIQGMLDSSARMVNGFTGLGLGVSAVKDISEAHASGDQHRIGRTLSVLRKLVWLTGFGGAVVFMILSPLLSKISFDTFDYTISFAAIAITLLFTQLADGQRALLQGTRHFGYMAKATISGSVMGVLTALPLFYFFRLKGIVPAIIVGSITTLAISWYYSHKVPYKKTPMSYREAVHEGKGMVKMGFFISLQTLLALLSGYIIRSFISRVGGVESVGLFVAGFAIVDTYVGMVFSSMGTEYYPRLATHSKGSVEEFNNVINQQIEIALVLVSPVICIFLIFGNWAVVLVYSAKFLPITMMMCLAIMSNYFKAPSWCIAYSYLAKGDSNMFFYNELIATVVNTTIKLVFYYKWGLTGIGMAFILCYFLYLIQVNVICHIRYGYIINAKIFVIFAPQFCLGVLCFLLFLLAPIPIRYSCGVLAALFSFYLSYKELNKRFNVIEAIKARLINRRG